MSPAIPRLPTPSVHASSRIPVPLVTGHPFIPADVDVALPSGGMNPTFAQ